MLLGLATIIGGTNPRAVGSILLFCFFAISHINHEIESGFIAKEQARLRSHIDIYENIINGTFLLSSPEQGEVVKFQYFGARARPAAPQPRVLQVLPVSRRRRDPRRPGRTACRRGRRAARRLGLRLTHLSVMTTRRQCH